MKRIIVQVRDKNNIHDLKTLGTVTHVSKYVNAILMEATPNVIPVIKANPNVLHVREGRIGEYQL